MMISIVVLTLLHLPTLKSACYKMEWTPLPMDYKYFIPKKNKKTFDDAKDTCAKIGGQLLVIHKDQTQQYIQQWMSREDCVNMYGIGLTNKDSKQFQWVDGTILGNKSYENWETVPTSTENVCVYVDWCAHGKWGISSCSTKRYFLCEADEPCSPHPVMRINNGTKLEDETVTIINEQYVLIACFLTGYTGEVSHVNVYCDRDKNDIGTGQQKISKHFYMDVKMHGKQCICEAIGIIAGAYQAYVIIDFLTSPRLADGSVDNQEFSVLEEGDAVLEFGIYANPDPVSYTMAHNGRAIGSYRYKLDVLPMEAIMFYSVRITLTSLLFNESGSYAMTIDNSLGPPLNYTFTVKVQAWGYMSRFLIIMSISLTTLLFLSTYFWFRYMCRAKKEEIVRRSRYISSMDGRHSVTPQLKRRSTIVTVDRPSRHVRFVQPSTSLDAAYEMKMRDQSPEAGQEEKS